MTDKSLKRFMTPHAWFAWGLAVVILLTFASIASVAVKTTMDIEQRKRSFKAIEVEKPISFFDKTYLKESDDK